MVGGGLRFWEAEREIRAFVRRGVFACCWAGSSWHRGRWPARPGLAEVHVPPKGSKRCIRYVALRFFTSFPTNVRLTFACEPPGMPACCWACPTRRVCWRVCWAAW